MQFVRGLLAAQGGNPHLSFASWLSSRSSVRSLISSSTLLFAGPLNAGPLNDHPDNAEQLALDTGFVNYVDSGNVFVDLEGDYGWGKLQRPGHHGHQHLHCAACLQQSVPSRPDTFEAGGTHGAGDGRTDFARAPSGVHYLIAADYLEPLEHRSPGNGRKSALSRWTSRPLSR